MGSIIFAIYNLLVNHNFDSDYASDNYDSDYDNNNNDDQGNAYAQFHIIDLNNINDDGFLCISHLLTEKKNKLLNQNMRIHEKDSELFHEKQKLCEGKKNCLKKQKQLYEERKKL